MPRILSVLSVFVDGRAAAGLVGVRGPPSMLLAGRVPLRGTRPEDAAGLAFPSTPADTENSARTCSKFDRMCKCVRQVCL